MFLLPAPCVKPYCQPMSNASQCICMSELASRLSTYWHTKRYSEWRCRSNSHHLHRRRVTWTQTKREGVKSGCSGALKTDKLGLSRKANKYSDGGTGDLDMLRTHETCPGDVGSTRPELMPPQVQVRWQIYHIEMLVGNAMVSCTPLPYKVKPVGTYQLAVTLAIVSCQPPFPTSNEF